MARYLERAEHLSLLLEVQLNALVDRPIRELSFGWHRIFKHLQAQPPAEGEMDSSAFSDDESLADAYTLADGLTFESRNEYSLWSCFSRARENARQSRHRISEQMWSCLNLSYLQFRETKLTHIWQDEPQQFYIELVEAINTFFGMASVSMFRDEGWDFMQLGKTIEHLQLRANLLSIQAQDSPELPADGSRDFEWTSLLYAYRAVWAYQRIYGIDIETDTALDMLVTNSDLPNSLMYGITRADERLHGLGTAPDAKAGDSALRVSGRLKSLIEHEWPETDDRVRMLSLITTLADRLHERIASAWFNYHTENAARQV